jgi:Icc-related predicted phosphoesterase
MVKFQIASDLHIEYRNDNNITDLDQYIDPTADVLILAGDIGNLYKFNQLKSFISLVCQKFIYVLYIPGNHEYYRVSHGGSDVNMNQLKDRLLELDETFPNLYVLNRNSICINDVCVAGCTLWSEAKTEIPSYIVRIKGISKNMYDQMHAKDKRFIMETINYCKDNNKKLLVVTHHAPTYKILSKKKLADKFVSLYASNMDNLLRYDYVHTWVCGHIHHNFDIVTDTGTHLVGNQKGKPKDGINDYRTDMTIDV